LFFEPKVVLYENNYFKIDGLSQEVLANSTPMWNMFKVTLKAASFA